MHFAPEIDQPVLKRLFRQWVQARGALAMPLPGALPLESLPEEVARHAVLFRVRPDQTEDGPPLRFEIVDHGAALAERYGPGARGRMVDEVLGGHEHDILQRVLESVARDRVVHFYRTTLTLAGGGAMLHTKLLLPLGAADTSVTAIIGGLCRTEPPPDGTLDNNYHSRFAALDVIEDRAGEFSDEA